MSEYIVTRVRHELAADATHRHISGVYTQGAIHFTRQEVIDSIRAGNSFRTLAAAGSARIHIVDCCRHDGCGLAPYIATNPDGTGRDDLEEVDTS